ncbi:MAG: hypothetical protein IKM39_04095, partial [Clostridia bacterium]|nr:hypothetical protein [Clostridia bacterium]
DPADYTYSIRVDDIRFMSVEYYEANFVSRNQVKDVVTAIAEIENKNDTSGIAAASAAYNALTAKQKAQVSNYNKLEEVGLIVDEQLHDCEGDFSTGTVLLPGGIYTTGDIPALETECYTQGNGAAGITWNNLDNKKLHTSFINYDEAGWDFSKATNLAFDMYVHGVKSVWSVGNGDQNICFGGSSMWNSSDLGTIGNANMQTLVSSQLQEGWNHVVISIPASARVDGVKNIHLYFENCLEFTADDPCVIFDDVRVLNENGLLIDQVRSVAKPVISQIAGLPATDRMTLQDKGAVDAARVAYNGLSDQAKEYVTNLADLVAAEDRIVVLQNQEIADKAAAQAVDAMIAALPAVNTLTLNDKGAVAAASDSYNALNDNAKGYVTNLADLQAAQAQIALLEEQLADENAPAFVIENITARAGDTITVAVKIKNNPGIVSAKVKVAYDADVLEVLSLEAGDFDGITFSPVTNNPLVFNWMDSIHPNNTTNGALAYITFKVKDTAAVGTTPLTITYDGDDVFDFDYNNVAFGKVNGVVTIAEYTPGDVNDDGAIDNKDLALIQRYLNDWDSALNEAAADVNRDGELNNKDYSTLERYLNGWDVVLA